MFDSYRWGNHTAMNMTPRNPQDLAGLSATNTVPVQGAGGHACVFPNGHTGINNVQFIVETDPTPLDPLHFLIVLPFNPWHLTMAQWAASRANINNNNPTTWLAPTATLFNLSQLYFAVAATAASSLSAAPMLDRVPHVSRGRVRLLWHVDYWDGPISGLALFESRHCWFEVADRDGVERRALLYPLDDSEWTQEREKHLLFRRLVGRHTDYDAYGRRAVGDVLPSEAWTGFFDAQLDADRPGKTIYTDRRPIASFDI